MLGRRSSILLLCLALTTSGMGRPRPAADGPEGAKEKATGSVPSFQDAVRPLFQAKCLRCHGEKARKADLDLSTPAGILKGGESGPAIVPGKPDQRSTAD
jgi:Planctomycete cytochrome C